eukprot:CAMPEP_0117850736 /NCGR_PEP_ID=MMETSP0949-20121206/21866_1 /TAXON_ID=44440 /ORGANISM="Chattonella subsalsa, Strain CCMP2191" /LENGTH=30 /DNA_ID= /DNA_START= /DNA_END= /DNA_ORIENTATION=
MDHKKSGSVQKYFGTFGAMLKEIGTCPAPE